MAENRFPLPIRALSFLFGLGALYLLVFGRLTYLSPNMALATDLAMGSIAVACFSVALWSRNETALQFKVVLVAVSVFLVGVTAIMGIGQGLTHFPSFPSFLFFSSALLGLAVLASPNRHFVSAR